MPPKTNTQQHIDWSPGSVAFIWRGKWYECAIQTGDTCLETALKAIIGETGCPTLEVLPRAIDHSKGDDDSLWTWYLVGLCWDDVCGFDDAGELRIPATRSNEAIDWCAHVYADLIGRPREKSTNYWMLSREGETFEMFSSYDKAVSYAADGYPT